MLERTLSLAAVATVATVVLPLASAPAATPSSFRLIAGLDRASMVRVDTLPKGISPGDVIVFSTRLRRAGKPDGRAEFVQTVVDGRFQGISMRADLLLADGTIELQGAGLNRRAPGGAKPSAQTEMAIVGGTGAYAGASGTVRLTDIGHASQRLDVNLR